MSVFKKLLIASILAIFIIPATAIGVAQSGNKNMAVLGTGEYVKLRVKERATATGEAKTKINEEILARVKTKAKNAIQNAIRRYEKVKTQVEKAEGITEDQKAEILVKIDAQIASMNELKIQVENANTAEEVKTVIAQVKTRFKYSLGLVRQMISGVYADRLTNIVERMTTIYDKLDVKVKALPDGEEKTDLGVLLSKAESLIVSAKEKITAENLDGAKADLVAAQEALKQVSLKVSE